MIFNFSYSMNISIIYLRINSFYCYDLKENLWLLGYLFKKKIKIRFHK
jgi:hypothetical protein